MYRFEEREALKYMLLLCSVILAFLIGLRIAYPSFSTADTVYSFLWYLFNPVQQISQFFQSLGFQKEVADILAMPFIWLLVVITIAVAMSYKKGKEGEEESGKHRYLR